MADPVRGPAATALLPGSGAGAAPPWHGRPLWIIVLGGCVPAARVLRRRGLPGLLLVCWALRTGRLARRQLGTGGLAAVRLPDPPRRVAGDRSTPDGPGSGVDRADLVLLRAVLRRYGANCLERSLVLWRWYAARRVHRTVVIGVTAPGTGFRAHAWLDGDADPDRYGMVELLRWPSQGP